MSDITHIPAETPDAPWIEPAKDPCRLPQAEQIETAERRRERLARDVDFARFEDESSGTPDDVSYAIADAIIASDRAAGADPDALRAAEAPINAALRSDKPKLVEADHG